MPVFGGCSWICHDVCSRYVSVGRPVLFVNQTRIRTDSVDSYTVVDDQGRSAIYREQDEKYKTITKILSNAEVRHDKENIYLYDNTSARIVLTGKHHSVTLLPTIYSRTAVCC